MSSLSTDARSLLRRRAGSGGADPQSLAALSAGLGISRAGVIVRLRRAIGHLRTAAQSTGCAGGTSIASDLQVSGSTLSGDAGAVPAADSSAVLGVTERGGPSQRRAPESGSGAAPPAVAETGPGDGLLVALVLLMLALLVIGALASRRVGPNRKTRPRRVVSPRLYSLATRAGFRYSHPRKALVLRGVGERFGPVLVSDEEPGPGLRRDARPPVDAERQRAKVG